MLTSRVVMSGGIGGGEIPGGGPRRRSGVGKPRPKSRPLCEPLGQPGPGGGSRQRGAAWPWPPLGPHWSPVQQLWLLAGAPWGSGCGPWHKLWGGPGPSHVLRRACPAPQARRDCLVPLSWAVLALVSAPPPAPHVCRSVGQLSVRPKGPFLQAWPPAQRQRLCVPVGRKVPQVLCQVLWALGTLHGLGDSGRKRGFLYLYPLCLAEAPTCPLPDPSGPACLLGAGCGWGWLGRSA